MRSLVEAVHLRRIEEQAAAPPDLECRVCGGHISSERNAVCGKCGGPRVARKLAEQDATLPPADVAMQWTADPVITTKERNVAQSGTDGRGCRKCGGPLRKHNTSGVHTRCKGLGSSPAEEMPQAPRSSPRSAKASDIVELFRMAAKGLGLDPDEVLEEFCSSWLAKARKGVT